MSIRHHPCKQLGIPITPWVPFMAGRSLKPGARFMRARRPPYEGYQDRVSGYYLMKHNKHPAEYWS